MTSETHRPKSLWEPVDGRAGDLQQPAKQTSKFGQFRRWDVKDSLACLFDVLWRLMNDDNAPIMITSRATGPA